MSSKGLNNEKAKKKYFICDCFRYGPFVGEPMDNAI